jgi:type I restriction enzyme M protein
VGVATTADAAPDERKPGSELTLRRLEDHLWAAADLFRNKVSNQKDYILAQLFFKRASDIYAEETEVALAELEGVEGAAEIARDRAYHVLEIPAGHSWDDVRNIDMSGMGRALNEALAAIGRANPRQLAGVFERTDFNNKMTLPADDLARIVDHFHKLGKLTNSRVPADMLGQAYEWLIAKFAAASGKGGGEFYTPAEVGRLLAEIVQPKNGDHIYDPTCGSGGLLLQCLQLARENLDVNDKSLFLYGQELNPETWAISRMNMLLHGAGEAAEIKLGDTLKDPGFTDGPKLKTFDICVANPPFSSSNWGHEWLKAGGDPWGRIKHLPPKSHGEMAFVQHMVASMEKDGRLAVVLPNGCFFRGGPELAVRKDLVDADLIEAVIQLPVDLFYGAMIPACVMVCRRGKTETARQRVLMIDASSEYARRDTKNVLTDDGIHRVAAALASGTGESGFSAWVSNSDLARDEYNLTVRRYVQDDSNDAPAASFADAVSAYLEARDDRVAAEGRLDSVLSSLEAQ